MKAIARIPNRPCVPKYDIFELDEVLAGALARVSQDASGRERSNNEQLDAAAKTCERKRRWTMHDTIYVEVGGASKFSKKRRKSFDQLIVDLEQGRYVPDVLMIWEVSRSTRKVEEMKILLSLCRWRGKYVYVIDDDQLCSPWSTNDWGWLMDAAVDAEKEVMRTSDRGQRASEKDAEEGRFNGGRRPFGFDSDGTTHRTGATPEGGINEKQLIVDAVRRILGGDSVRTIAKEWNDAGVRTPGTANNPDGNEWKPSTLAKMLKAPRLAGLRIHHSVVQDKPAEWDPIISKAEHDRLVAVLNSRTPGGSRGRTPRMLTGLLFCDLCKAQLVSNTHGGRRFYHCRKGFGFAGCGKVAIKGEDVERVLGEALAMRLVDDQAREAAQTGPDDEAERAELDQVLARRSSVISNRRRYPDDDAYFEELAMVKRQQKDIEVRIAAKVKAAPPALDMVDLGRPWSSLDDAERRRRLDHYIEYVWVGPAANRGSHVFDQARVIAPGRIKWRR